MKWSARWTSYYNRIGPILQALFPAFSIAAIIFITTTCLLEDLLWTIHRYLLRKQYRLIMHGQQ